MRNPQKAGYLLRNILGSKVVKTDLKGLPYQLFCYHKAVCSLSHDKTRNLLALISSEFVVNTRVFFKSGESRAQNPYAAGGLKCPGRKFTPTDA
ncbi:hypothetical protein TNCV_3092071 [Trichonephila clavipes]|uniref:Uncharacterized protein n=1 Tax=Trichonephila clavipes TaxID=2585209 RepID=A0A8X6RZG9_TRICX|nr:hypothetical protein TNCV_4361681 [Trichonephila clavipes]GFY03581.1 hypothetical protein TNCV_3092071 [Trichonephila clavipes]